MSFSNLVRAFQPLRLSVLRTSAPASQYLSRPTIFQRSIASTSPKFLEQQPEQPPQPPQQEQQEQQSEHQPEQEQKEQQEQPPIRTRKASKSVKTKVPPSLRQYPYKLKKGTVVSAGRMERTVRVEHLNIEWDAHLRKYYPKKVYIKVSDPRESLREGDVIEFSSGAPKGRRVNHVVERIIAPFGQPLEDRPAVMTREERDAERATKRQAKWQRRETKRREAAGGDKKLQKQTQKHSPSREHIGRIQKLIHQRRKSKVPALTPKKAAPAAEAAEAAQDAKDVPAAKTAPAAKANLN
ncbi:nucleic acid-binding protein [Aspergillus homomorphus CBS 101889]|uniref:Nucleic acid-binding protein n=1 Tax=Aspergillus homomorphus (strain CBS 101889) TaxID=1450537 RepID=A0A395HP11_ASPHC|nr:nucleic acid-binding protein [Aspergillus homomorphus CBS 101889]RAL09671.1 nucleic acid-binding protein [Aspergillus homomorphus CBS 101889]